jgi:hypothetical protein
MIAFEITQYNPHAERYHFLAVITAETPEEAKQKFIKRNNYRARRGFALFVKTAGCL